MTQSMGRKQTAEQFISSTFPWKFKLVDPIHSDCQVYTTTASTRLLVVLQLSRQLQQEVLATERVEISRPMVET